MKLEDDEAHLVRVSWADDKTLGGRMTMLYAALTNSASEAEDAVRALRPETNKVEATGDYLSSETTKLLRLVPGQAMPL